MHEGEILGLVGENGVGKTTLMSILSALPFIAQTGEYGGKMEDHGKALSSISGY